MAAETPLHQAASFRERRFHSGMDLGSRSDIPVEEMLSLGRILVSYFM